MAVQPQLKRVFLVHRWYQQAVLILNTVTGVSGSLNKSWFLQLHPLLLFCCEDTDHDWRTAGSHHRLWDLFPAHQLLCWRLCFLYHDWSGWWTISVINMLMTIFNSYPKLPPPGSGLRWGMWSELRQLVRTTTGPAWTAPSSTWTPTASLRRSRTASKPGTTTPGRSRACWVRNRSSNDFWSQQIHIIDVL